jgi:hypothetical protein
MPIDPTVAQQHSGPGAAENCTESVTAGTSVDPDRFTDRGEGAEGAGFRADGVYSGGDFADGRDVVGQRRDEEQRDGQGPQ